MIADTNFVSELFKERRAARVGVATRFFNRHRAHTIRLSIITAGEILVWFESSAAGVEVLKPWTIYPLHLGIVETAADIDRALIATGQRLGENDNWIAGFARYYQEPVVSRDTAFDRAPGVRRVAY